MKALTHWALRTPTLKDSTYLARANAIARFAKRANNLVLPVWGVGVLAGVALVWMHLLTLAFALVAAGALGALCGWVALVATLGFHLLGAARHVRLLRVESALRPQVRIRWYLHVFARPSAVVLGMLAFAAFLAVFAEGILALVPGMMAFITAVILTIANDVLLAMPAGSIDGDAVLTGVEAREDPRATVKHDRAMAAQLITESGCAVPAERTLG